MKFKEYINEINIELSSGEFNKTTQLSFTTYYNTIGLIVRNAKGYGFMVTTENLQSLIKQFLPQIQKVIKDSNAEVKIGSSELDYEIVGSAEDIQIAKDLFIARVESLGFKFFKKASEYRKKVKSMDELEKELDSI